MAAHDDRSGPAGHQARYVLADDRLSKDHTAKNIAYVTIRRPPHFFQAEFFDPGLVRGDRGTFDTDPVLFDRISRIYGDLVIGVIANLNSQIVVFQIDIQIGQDQFFFDEVPHDPGHFIPVEFNNRVFHLDLGHRPQFL